MTTELTAQEAIAASIFAHSTLIGEQGDLICSVRVPRAAALPCSM